MTGRPLHRLPAAERTAVARRLEGLRVRIVFSALRDPEFSHECEGMLVAVAQPITGAACELAIVRCDGKVAAAISLATVLELEQV